ncbi:MAG: FtsX-like permease family protein [Bacilli bacterium]|nr:FtsX-like permease family protein [Bacilli bacterium]
MINHTNMSVKMAIRNILVQPSRALMSIAGVMGCVALLVCAFGIGDTVNHSIDNELDEQFSYDINTTYTLPQETELFTYLDQINADYESYRSGFVSVVSSKEKMMDLYIIEADSSHTTIDVSKGILLSKSKADELGVVSGDTVRVTSNNTTVEVVISGIVNTSVSQGIFMSKETFETLDLNLRTSYHLWITCEDASDEILNHINEMNGTNGAWLESVVRSQINDSLTSINTIRNTMVIFSILLSVVVLYNFALLNMIDRIRDIATLKVLGLPNFAIGKMLIYEMMFLVTIGTIFGLLLGYPFLVLVMSSNKVDVMAFLYYIKPVSYIYAAAISLFTALFFNIVFTVYIRKINMIESLKSIE